MTSIGHNNNLGYKINKNYTSSRAGSQYKYEYNLKNITDSVFYCGTGNLSTELVIECNLNIPSQDYLTWTCFSVVQPAFIKTIQVLFHFDTNYILSSYHRPDFYPEHRGRQTDNMTKSISSIIPAVDFNCFNHEVRIVISSKNHYQFTSTSVFCYNSLFAEGQSKVHVLK